MGSTCVSVILHGNPCLRLQTASKDLPNALLEEVGHRAAPGGVEPRGLPGGALLGALVPLKWPSGGRAGTAVPVSEDHKPTRMDEKKRIERVGGLVLQVRGAWRVATSTNPNSMNKAARREYQGLAMTRSFGDLQGRPEAESRKPFARGTSNAPSVWRWRSPRFRSFLYRTRSM